MQEHLDVKETLSGWNVGRSCPVCNNSFVFVHNSRDKERAITAVNMKFEEVHAGCLSR